MWGSADSLHTHLIIIWIWIWIIQACVFVPIQKLIKPHSLCTSHCSETPQSQRNRNFDKISSSLGKHTETTGLSNLWQWPTLHISSPSALSSPLPINCHQNVQRALQFSLRTETVDALRISLYAHEVTASSPLLLTETGGCCRRKSWLLVLLNRGRTIKERESLHQWAA